MTSRKGGQQFGSKKPWSPPKFVDQPLLKSQIDQLKVRTFSADECDKCMLVVLEQGYKVSCSFDERHGAFAAYLTQTREDGPNYGWTLTGRGSGPMKALKQLFYKHFVIFENVLWGAGNGFGAEDMDD